MKKLYFVFIIISSITFAQNYGTWTLTDSLNFPRQDAAATKLANGNVLVSGGLGNDSGYVKDAEVFDYKTEKWKTIKPMIIARGYHKLVRLNNGNILAIAGFGTKSCEIYDTTSKTWSLTDSLKIAISFGESITLLNNGYVLVVGGLYITRGGFRTLNTCEIYDPNTSKWAIADSLKIDREYHTATKLTDGRVLVTGGVSWTKEELTDSEIYDPKTNKWSEAAPLNIARGEHSATLLPDGEVLVTGGENYSNPTSSWLKSCEVYDPVKNTWTIVDSLLVPHAYHSAILLKSGLLLIAGGGYNSSLWELYDTNNFTNIYIGNFPGRTTDTSIGEQLINILPNGKVLSAGGVVGNVDSTGLLILNPASVCYLYDPNDVNAIYNVNNNNLKNFKLYQNYPNPFNPTTAISYQLSELSFVHLNVYNILGEKIKILVDKEQQAGNYTVNFDGNKLSSGVYFYQLRAGKFISTKKMLLLK